MAKPVYTNEEKNQRADRGYRQNMQVVQQPVCSSTSTISTHKCLVLIYTYNPTAALNMDILR